MTYLPGSFVEAKISYHEINDFMETKATIYEHQHENIMTVDLPRACDLQNIIDRPEIKAMKEINVNETNDIPGLIDIKQVKDNYEINNRGTESTDLKSACEEAAYIETLEDVRVSPSVRGMELF